VLLCPRCQVLFEVCRRLTQGDFLGLALKETSLTAFGPCHRRQALENMATNHRICAEQIEHGLDNAFQTFLNLFVGGTSGKLILKLI